MKSSNYKGVSYHKNIKKWISFITIDKKRKHLGYFDDEKEAGEKYKKVYEELMNNY